MKLKNSISALGRLGALAMLLAACGPANPAAKPDPVDPQVTTVTAGNPTFLLISDIHLNQALDTVETWKNTPQCSCCGHYSDTGTALWTEAKSAIEAIVDPSNASRPRFMVFLGDMPAHNESGSKLKGNIATVLTDLRTIAQQNCIPLVYSPGNNDNLDGDYSAFTDSSGNITFTADTGDPSAWPLIVPPSASCSGAAPATIANQDSIHLGYYSAYPLGKSAKLRTITLNSVIFDQYYPGNDAHLHDQKSEAFGQLRWLEAQLKDAASAHEQVILTMHIPPGKSYYGGRGHANWASNITNKKRQNFEARFGEIVTGADNIAALLYGHTHYDELKVIEGGSAPFIALSCPGITPQHCNNPGFKVVTYDPTSFAPTGFTTHYADFSGSRSRVFDQAYTFATSYGTGSGPSIFAVIDSLHTNGDDSSIEAGLCATYEVKDENAGGLDCSGLLSVTFVDYDGGATFAVDDQGE